MIITYASPQQSTQRLETSTDRIVIGRSPAEGSHLDLDLVSDLYVSHVHACLSCESGRFWIEDLGSVNGTWIDEKRISTKTQVHAGSAIKIGFTRIAIEAEPAEENLAKTQPAQQGSEKDDLPFQWDFENEEMSLEWVAPAAEEPVWDLSGDDPDLAATEIGPPVERSGRDGPIGGEKRPAAETAAVARAKSGDSQAATVITGSPDTAATVITGRERETRTVTRDPGDGDLAATVAARTAAPGEAEADQSRTEISVEPTVMTEPPPLPVQPPAEDENRGDIICITADTASRFPLRETVGAQDLLTLVWRQLKAFNELSQALNAAQTLSELVNLLVSKMPGVVPNAQRGAVLMPDQQDRLLLKAHWPAGEHSVSMTWVQRAYATREPFIWALPEGREGPQETPRSALYYQVQSAIYAPLMVGEQIFGVMYVDNYLTREAFSATDFELLKAIGSHVALFIRDRLLQEARDQEKAIQEKLQRQFSPAIAGRVGRRIDQLQLDGDRVDPVTILVSDVRNFTAMSARMAPHEVVRMLNEMFDAFVPIIFEYGGTVDKYVGDSVLAVFGSPEPDDRQWEKALRAAMEMQQAVGMLGEGRRVRRLPVFEVGISIHSGEAIHGFIGSHQRMEYTVIGDTVNRASRLCDGAGPGEVVISQSVYEHVYRIAEVVPKVIRTKHCDTEPDLNAYVVTRLQ